MSDATEALRAELFSARSALETAERELAELRAADTIRPPSCVEVYIDGAIRGALADFAAHDLLPAVRSVMVEAVAEGISQYERSKTESNGDDRCEDCPRRVVGVT